MAEVKKNSETLGFKLFGKTIQLDVKKEEMGKEGETQGKKPEKMIPCPRCKSMETKFCYFNNYNVNQPRHFCKGCQRYWTAGGTLRNVPVGAGRRKAKPSCEEGMRFGGECMFDESEVKGFDINRVMQQWQMDNAARGGGSGFQRGFPAKRQCTTSAGQIC